MTASSLRVGINAQIVTFGSNYRRAGVSRFTEQMILALQRRDRSNRYSVFLNDSARGGEFHDSTQFKFHRARLPTSRPWVRILWEQLWLPALARWAELDLLHCPVNVMPLLNRRPTVLTIHDLTFLLFPDRFRPERRRYLTLLTRMSAQRAVRIMTDSENTKRDVQRLLKLPEERIDVVYPGVETGFQPSAPEDVAEFRQRHQLPDRFILYVGTLEPRKNVDQLIRAYGLLVKRGLHSCPLVIAGAQGWMVEQIFSEVERSGAREQILFPGYVDPDELPRWYAAATLFVYPSLYEGFGFPPLEAMACGTPVIVSNVSSLPEVAGDAATMVDPTRPEDLADAMAEVLESQEKRDRMTQAGLRHAATFSWDRAASQIMAVYKQATQ